MTRNIMTHDEAHEVLEALALDALEVLESAAALAHVAECDACTAALAALRQAAEQLAYASSPVAMVPAQRARVRGRLLARASADSAQGASVAPMFVRPTANARTARRRPLVDPVVLGAIAAVLIAVVSVVVAISARRGRDEARDAVQGARAQELTHRAALDSLHAIVADRDQLIANLTGPQVAVMSLTAANPRSPSARMFWDQRHDAWTFVAHNLRRPGQGRVYQLWLVTPSAKINAGMFMPLANGDAVVRATYKMDPGTLAAVAVTDEPAGGSAQPTTPPMLAVTSGR
jgi:Anti-sigma-K factor rskA